MHRDRTPGTEHARMATPAMLICARSPALLVALALALAACGTTARREAPIPPTMEKDAEGKYYLDDGPGPNPPANIEAIPDAVPRLEPLNRGASRPYTVMGRQYVPMANLSRYKARGNATWYGRRYHGKPTSSGEIYDMYAMTAAHPTLPIPSYARVTNLANGKSVIVRINDRGPFIGDRLIDLSYTAAYKLGLVTNGSGLVEVETILPGDPLPVTAAKAVKVEEPPKPAADNAAPRAAPAPPAPAATPLPPVASSAPPVQPAARDTALVTKTSAVDVSTASDRAAAAASGVYVQFGAFRSRENAENLLSRLREQAGWLATRLDVLPSEGLYRVHAGPYASQAEARQIVERIGDLGGPRPILLKW
ncbi:MAG TPA: septal ring lytic transglycosylase RlpA family protein [Burkholderiales bacterium]|nr:septal ring lytic transglycosylase RlpA family protein [Burkholderiales bacterium]